MCSLKRRVRPCFGLFSDRQEARPDPVLLGDSLQSAGVIALPTPIKLPPLPLRLLYSTQMAKDTEIIWLRNLVSGVVTGLIAESERVGMADPSDLKKRLRQR